ncbi:hypothetical protein ACT3SY_18630 [Brachybacterium sp. AOP42-E1-35]|uniref:hypothetical protein n=1 Tax=Brachybacterium sp. AOP42-E1-35 TaxID=3457664 RepID=UPI00402AD07B
MNDHGPERRAIREAMTRLLEGQPVRSEGKLTIKSLAEEAGLKRWILTHRHTDLQDEFRSRVSRRGIDPGPVRVLKERLRNLEEENQRFRAELREAKATTAMLERQIAVDALETRGPAVARPVPLRLHSVSDLIQSAEEPPTEPRG